MRKYIRNKLSAAKDMSNKKEEWSSGCMNHDCNYCKHTSIKTYNTKTHVQRDLDQSWIDGCTHICHYCSSTERINNNVPFDANAHDASHDVKENIPRRPYYTYTEDAGELDTFYRHIEVEDE